MTSDCDARIAALEILVEQLIAERCLVTDDPFGTVAQAEDRLADLARRDERVTPEVLNALTGVLERVAKRIREAETE